MPTSAADSNSRLIRYYSGQDTDNRGRTLAETQALDHRAMEFYHDFIQWLFPLRQASQYNPDAPTLTDDDVHAFHARPELRENLRKSFVAFLGFLGLVEDQGAVVEADRRRVDAIFTTSNHNWLRVTRVLLCLHTLGLRDECQAFFAFLRDLHESRGLVSASTFAYWSSAANGIAR